ncbi:MAG: hypothetical protein HN849_34665 [Victivallales bacterium]|nr:hypothetical protein [Victivallales bacterium]MBT7304726.1 hypothetical protein [Victivallales bacterium]
MKRSLFALVALLGVLTARADDPALVPLQLSICPPVQLMQEDTDIIGLKLNLPYGYNRSVRGFDLGVVGGAENCEAIQINLFNIVPGRARGLSGGLINLMGSCEGVQVGTFNFIEEDLVGMQVGTLNVARKVTGVQIGLVNYCDELWGMQFGLANIAGDAPLPFTVLVNASF